MSTPARLLCAFVASAIFLVTLRAQRTGRFDTAHGSIDRLRRPLVFRLLVAFWFLASAFLWLVASGIYGRLVGA